MIALAASETFHKRDIRSVSSFPTHLHTAWLLFFSSSQEQWSAALKAARADPFAFDHFSKALQNLPLPFAGILLH